MRHSGVFECFSTNSSPFQYLSWYYTIRQQWMSEWWGTARLPDVIGLSDLPWERRTIPLQTIPLETFVFSHEAVNEEESFITKKYYSQQCIKVKSPWCRQFYMKSTKYSPTNVCAWIPSALIIIYQQIYLKIPYVLQLADITYKPHFSKYPV